MFLNWKLEMRGCEETASAETKEIWLLLPQQYSQQFGDANIYCVLELLCPAVSSNLTHLAPDQPLPFRYEIPCEGK